MTMAGSPKVNCQVEGAIFASELARLAELPPYDRFDAARAAMADAQAYISALAEVTAGCSAELRSAGLQWHEVGELLGISVGHASNLAKRNGRAALAPELESVEGPDGPVRVSPALRAEGRKAAEQAAAILNGLPMMGTPHGDLGGEWDWFRACSTAERARLRRKWARGTHNGPDVVGFYLARQLGRDETDITGIMQTWLDLTRRVDMGRALASGRWPRLDAYGGVTPAQLFAEAAPERPTDERWIDTLRPCSEGPCPSTMTFAEWDAEVSALLADVGALADVEWLDHAAERPVRRLAELVPIDDGATRVDVFRKVSAGYRLLATR